MYGLVNRAIKELVLMQAGPGVWAELTQEVGFEAGSFVDDEPYPDELTYALVGAVSERLEMPAADVLRTFGRHWLLFTSQSRYGHLLDSFGTDFEEFLEHLDDLHQQVAGVLPGLQPPRFSVSETRAGLLVTYESEREALEPMVLGLLEGVLEFFGAKGTVQEAPRSAAGDARFLIVEDQ